MPFVERPSTRVGALLLVLGIAPFAAGAALGGVDGPRVCPFSLVTGAPCPLCGSTRSFALAAQGDPDFLRFNAVWVFAAAATALAGIVLLALASRGRRGVPRLPPRAALPAAMLAVAVAWAWALVQRDVIVT